MKKEEDRKTEPTEAAQKPVSLPEKIVTTMKEYGAKLPMGIPGPDGILRKPFTFHPWNTSRDKDIGKKKRANITSGQLVPELMNILVREIGGVNLDAIEGEGARLLTFHRMCLQDVLYAYFYLRYEEFGNIVNLTVRCPNCREVMRRFPADLNTLQVKVYPEGTKKDDIVSTFELNTPIKIGEKSCKTFIINPTPWSMMTSLTGEDAENDAVFKERMVQSSVVNVIEMGVPAFTLTPDHVDQIRKRDLEELIAAIADLNGGAELVVEGRCMNPNCRSHFFQAIDWTYDSFFVISSR